MNAIEHANGEVPRSGECGQRIQIEDLGFVAVAVGVHVRVDDCAGGRGRQARRNVSIIFQENDCCVVILDDPVG